MFHHSISIEELKKLISPEDYYKTQLGPPKKRIKDEAIWFCPFHDDQKTPNFRVNLNGGRSGLYICDACGAGGDIIKFHMKNKGMSFSEAIHDLARTYHLIHDDTPPPAPIDYEKMLLHVASQYGDPGKFDDVPPDFILVNVYAHLPCGAGIIVFHLRFEHPNDKTRKKTTSMGFMAR